MVIKEGTVWSQVLGLKAGELVEVRSEAEILATLDSKGELDSLPFMPEMRQFCGRRFRVAKRAVKLCDTISWTGMYRMENAVHLEGVRCDGQAHGGCQAGCNTYWKEAWLKRLDDEGRESVAAESLPAATAPAGPPSGCSIAELMAATRKDADASGEEVYSCQATELLRAAPTRVPPWDLKQYVLDVSSGNTGVLALIRSVAVGVFNEYQDASRRLPRPLRIRGGRRYPFIEGKLRKTPHEALDLQPGELVRVKSKEEIVRTLDANNRNRGMSFDAEMLKYCGRQARVLRRVDRIIDEPSGRMMRLKNPCIILEDVICTSDFHRLCPRAIYPYWREIWLERA
ncbi:MAG TPA: hypothetical protein VF486_23030 [Actinomycetes bacterium]